MYTITGTTANFIMKIEMKKKEYIDKKKKIELVSKAQRDVGRLELEELELKINLLERRKLIQSEQYHEQQIRRLSRMKREVNRTLNAMLKSRRDVMSLIASHVIKIIFCFFCFFLFFCFESFSFRLFLLLSFFTNTLNSYIYIFISS